MGQHNYRNLILRNLGQSSIERLDLRPVALEIKQVLETPGSRVDQLFFIEEGIGSMTATFEDGSQVENGMYGPETAIGALALIGVPTCTNRVTVQVPGHGFSCRLESAEREFRRCEDFQRLVLRFIASHVIQAAQTAGCNARHNVQQRLSRWLLQCRDRVDSDVLQLTQEFMADMLGVERPAVSVVAVKLQERGLIEYSRGRVRIKNRKGLESVTCECYWAAKAELENFSSFAEAGRRV